MDNNVSDQFIVASTVDRTASQNPDSFPIYAYLFVSQEKSSETIPVV